MPAITKRFVDKLRSDDTRELFLWDDEVRGFGLRVMPAVLLPGSVRKEGARTYIVQYRNEEGRTRRLAIGKVGTLTPEQARQLAKDKLHEVSQGEDPSAQRKAARQAMTVGELCDWYLEQAGAGTILGRSNRPIKASTLAMDRSRIERHVKPLLGTRSIRGLAPQDVRQLQAQIAAGKTKQAKAGAKRKRGGEAKGGSGVAGRTLAMFKAILGHARAHGLMSENPGRDVKRHTDTKATRFLEGPELGQLGAAMRTLESEGENPVSLAVIRFLLLSGFRRMEATDLEMEWIDAKRRCVRFPDTKGGAQVRPLAGSAIDILGAVPRPEGTAYAFPGIGGTQPYKGLPKALERVCTRAGLEGVTPHVLRHTFASVARDLEFSEFTIAGLLGHAGRSVTARYAHASDSSLVAAAERVASTIAAALDGTAEAGAEAGNLVQFRR